MIVLRAASPADAPGIARVQVSTWRTAYAGIVAGTTLAEMSVERSTQNWRRGLERPDAIAFVGEAAEQIVGFAYGGRQRDEALPQYDGELYALYVLDSYQGLGIGRKLVDAFNRAMVGAGYQKMLLWVLKENAPARAFYERIGGKYVAEKTIIIGGQELREVAYGWDYLRENDD